jgi:FkbM family methyltransferase
LRRCAQGVARTYWKAAMSVKSAVKGLVQMTGYDIVQYVPELNRPFSVLPMLVRERVARGEDLFIVQVGANDGIMDDPLRELIHEHHFPGLLIEPLPDLFERLQHNYRAEPQLTFENVAILDHDGTVEIHRVRSDADVPEHWHGIASFNRRNLLSQGVPKAAIERVMVKATTFKGLLAKHGVTRIGLLQVDTEGYDYEVIRAALATGILPDMINYEHCWLVPQTRLACKQMLDRHGYKFLEVGKDTLAVRAEG